MSSTRQYYRQKCMYGKDMRGLAADRIGSSWNRIVKYGIKKIQLI